MINRREFIVGTVALAAVPIQTIARAPFVEAGDSVDFLYFEDWVRPFQPHNISAVVARVDDWNGKDYPIVLRYWRYDRIDYWDGLDSEWSMFRKEVPEFNWGNMGMNRYPNIHAYVREKRLGENPQIMRDQMERNRLSHTFKVDRGVVPVRVSP